MLEMRRRGLTATRISPLQVVAGLGTLTSGPGQDERLDWSYVPGHTRRVWTDVAIRSALLREALDAVCPSSQQKLLVVFHPSYAGIRSRAEDVAKAADLILDANPEVWICAAEGADWLIESANSDREICWGRPVTVQTPSGP